MPKALHVWPEEPRTRDGEIEVSAVIEVPGRERQELWYRIPAACRQHLPARSDHFVVGAIFLLMQEGLDVRVHGQVSPSLLRNLAEFQSAWVAMHNGLTAVDIYAESEEEPESSAPRDQTVMPFSAGVDSCYTAFRHARGIGTRFPRKLTAGVMVHGFDIPLADKDAFALAAVRSGRILSSLGLELITISTNYRDLVADWNHSHGAAISSCLHLFSERFSAALIGQTFTYGELRHVAEGVNALTDPLLSSDAFRVVPDGAALERADKILAMRDWPEFLSNVRVCWQGAQKDRNCCRCEKCIRNILTFRALGLGLPSGFDEDVSDSQIRALNPGDLVRATIRYSGLAQLAEAHGASGPWVRVLQRRLQLNSIRRRLQSGPLKYFLKAPYYAGRVWARIKPGGIWWNASR